MKITRCRKVKSLIFYPDKNIVVHDASKLSKTIEKENPEKNTRKERSNNIYKGVSLGPTEFFSWNPYRIIHSKY